jgi:multidrug efflux pump subunit AcrA (membrane-fusion protein)
MFSRLRANPLALLLGAVAVAAVVLSVSALGGSTPSATATERTVAATKGVVQSTVSGSGNLEPRSTHDLSFSASGKVTAVDVKAGDTVRKGQLLAKIDPSSAEATLAQAKADLQDAEDALDSADDSSSSSSSSSSTSSSTTSSATTTASAQAKVDADRLTVASAEEALAGTKLYAPISGTISTVGVSVGDTVGSSSSSSGSSSTGDASSSSTSSSSSSTAIELVNLKRYKMTVSLSESDINDVKAGQAATVTVNAANSEEFAARVLSVDLLSADSSSSSTSSSSSSSSAVSYSVTLELTQSSSALRSGMSATAEIVTSQTSGLLVPTAAISGGTVTVIKNGVKSARQVQTGVAGDSVTQITSGLTTGEQVVVTSASAAAGAAASSSSSSTSSSGSQQQSGSGLTGAVGGGAAGGGTGGPPSGAGFAGGGR